MLRNISTDNATLVPVETYPTNSPEGLTNYRFHIGSYMRFNEDTQRYEPDGRYYAAIEILPGHILGFGGEHQSWPTVEAAEQSIPRFIEHFGMAEIHLALTRARIALVEKLKNMEMHDHANISSLP